MISLANHKRPTYPPETNVIKVERSFFTMTTNFVPWMELKEKVKETELASDIENMPYI